MELASAAAIDIEVRPTGGESALLPVETRSGIEVMSLNLLLPHEDDAVMLPIDPELAELCDSGEVESHNSEAFVALSLAFVQALPAVAPSLYNQD